MTDDIPKPKTPKGGWKQVAMGLFHTVALRQDGTVACWGSNYAGQCAVPANLGPVAQVAVGDAHTVALKQDGTVACWGDNDSGQCTVPSNLGPVAQVAAGAYHTVALKADGTVACWGWNGSGQCTVPADLGPVAAIDVGRHYTGALKADGTVFFCGGISCLDDIPWEISDEAWLDFVADHGNSVRVTKIIPARVRRTEKYRCMRMLMKL